MIRLSESARTAVGKIEFGDQSELQQVFSAVWELESQVNNGGFHQYFFDTSGETAVRVESALIAIAARKAAAIVREAVALFPGGMPPSDMLERRRRLELADERVLARWNELDQAFFSYPDPLTDLLHAFVEKHPEEFGQLS